MLGSSHALCLYRSASICIFFAAWLYDITLTLRHPLVRPVSTCIFEAFVTCSGSQARVLSKYGNLRLLSQPCLSRFCVIRKTSHSTSLCHNIVSLATSQIAFRRRRSQAVFTPHCLMLALPVHPLAFGGLCSLPSGFPFQASCKLHLQSVDFVTPHLRFPLV